MKKFINITIILGVLIGLLVIFDTVITNFMKMEPKVELLDNVGATEFEIVESEPLITNSYFIYSIIDRSMLEEWLKLEPEKKKYLLYIEITDERNP